MYLLWMYVCVPVLAYETQRTTFGSWLAVYTVVSSFTSRASHFSPALYFLTEFSAISFVRLFRSAPNQLELTVKHPYLNFIDLKLKT